MVGLIEYFNLLLGLPIQIWILLCLSSRQITLQLPIQNKISYVFYLIFMNYYLYMHRNNINLISDITNMFHIYLTFKFYYLGSQQKNISCIRVTNTSFSHLILEIVQLAILIAWVVLNIVLFTLSRFIQWRALIIHHHSHFYLYLHRCIWHIMTICSILITYFLGSDVQLFILITQWSGQFLNWLLFN